jgi:hypothetical protein
MTPILTFDSALQAIPIIVLPLPSGAFYAVGSARKLFNLSKN